MNSIGLYEEGKNHYSPVPNNSPPPRLLIFGFFVGPPFLIWTPLSPRLLIFQILFCRYLNISEIVKTNCSFCETVNSLV